MNLPNNSLKTVALEEVSTILKTVPRYDISIAGGCDCCGSWVEEDECKGGDWVKFKDLETTLELLMTDQLNIKN